MAILAFLGWESYPIARLAKGSRAEQLIADLEKCNVRTEFSFRQQHGTTPVIIVRIQETENGTYKRSYECKHPSSGEWFPRYRPVPKGLAELLKPQLPVAVIFYFDRAEPSSLDLATYMRDCGAVVFFEPCSFGKSELFSDCLGAADFVKYSAERLPDPPQNPIWRSPRFEVQTLGTHGLRYRSKLDTNTPGPWRLVLAFSANPYLDATGCGDWCSAGLIHKLCQAGWDQFMCY